MRRLIALALACLIMAPAASAQSFSPGDREQSRAQNRLGWEQMRGESYEQAVKHFQKAIAIDAEFEMPFYGLGRAHMALKQYVSAISALTRCRDLYRALVGRQFSNQQEAQRYRTNRITEIDEMIRQVQSGPQTIQAQDQLRQLQEQRRQMQDIIARGNHVTIDAAIPAWVSLSLGSAYFRSGQLADAEREYKATLEADKRSGEAHNNLAVVYLETGRIAEAEASLKDAKKAGFRVNPQLEQAIKKGQ
ncbi:MAG: tetratricopeptide repeat protein [Acidobacteria bacterium]|nr:tetratricopeptide repeat protein [Acidobacteriota bacterium]